MIPVKHDDPAAGDAEPDDKRLQVLRAARRELASAGYEGVRLRDIARRAGVSIGLLQHYFDTRQQLLARTFEQTSHDTLDRWKRLVEEEDDPWRRIVMFVDQFEIHADELRDHCAVWTEFCSSSARRPELREPLRRIYAGCRELFTTTIEDGIARGQFAPVLPTDVVVDILLTTLDGCEMAIAADIGFMSGERMTTVVLRTAAVMLGVDADVVAAPRASTA